MDRGSEASPPAGARRGFPGRRRAWLLAGWIALAAAPAVGQVATNKPGALAFEPNLPVVFLESKQPIVSDPCAYTPISCRFRVARH